MKEKSSSALGVTFSTKTVDNFPDKQLKGETIPTLSIESPSINGKTIKEKNLN